MPRIVFTLDKDSLEQLQKLTDERGFETMGETVRDALKVYIALGDLADAGYTEVQAEHFSGRSIKTDYISRLHDRPAQGVISRVNRLIGELKAMRRGQ